MSLIRVSADNPAALLAAAVLLFVLGVVGIGSLPIQMLPNLEYPEVNINTSWRNAAPQEVEASIVEPQETALRQVPGVAEMSSSVRSGNGNVNLRFDVGVDLQQAMLDVLNALNQAEPLPLDAQEPQIQVGGWDFPVATLLVHALVPTPGVDVADYQRIIDTEVEPRLLEVAGGIARVNSERSGEGARLGGVAEGDAGDIEVPVGIEIGDGDGIDELDRFDESLGVVLRHVRAVALEDAEPA